MLYSQSNLCVPDCPDIAWSNEKVIVVSMSPQFPGCDIEVRYVDRPGCNGGTKWDFQLTGVYSFLSGPACDPIKNALLTDGAAAESMLRLINEKAMAALIVNHFLTLNVKPECGQGVQVSYRAIHGRCFQRHSMQQTPTTNGIYVSYVTERCGDACCLWLFGACLNSTSQQVEVTVISSPTSGPPCPFSTLNPTVRCNGLCFDT